MSQPEKDLIGSSKRQKLGPDYFGYYTHQVVELLSRDEDVSPNGCEASDVFQRSYEKVTSKEMTEHCNGISGSLFSDSLENELSDPTKERLRLFLKQGAKVLASEVDEMLEPVLALHQLNLQLESRKLSKKVDKGNAPPSKRLKKSSSSSNSLSALSNHTTPESNRKGDDDLQFLIENNSLQVEEAVKKSTDQYCATLGHMEQQLEKILDTVMSKCRPMTILEKHKLGKFIQKLPGENLDRVIEILQNGNVAQTSSSDEIQVDLEKESNVTLWRLFYYVKAVEKARMLTK